MFQPSLHFKNKNVHYSWHSQLSKCKICLGFVSKDAESPGTFCKLFHRYCCWYVIAVWWVHLFLNLFVLVTHIIGNFFLVGGVGCGGGCVHPVSLWLLCWGFGQTCLLHLHGRPWTEDRNWEHIGTMEVLKVSSMPRCKKLSNVTFCLTDGNPPPWKMYHNDYVPFH